MKCCRNSRRIGMNNVVKPKQNKKKTQKKRVEAKRNEPNQRMKDDKRTGMDEQNNRKTRQGKLRQH